MQRRLAIQNQDIAILQVPVHLLVYSRCAGVQAPPAHYRSLTFLGSEQLVCDGRSLFNGEFILTNVSTSVNNM